MLWIKLQYSKVGELFPSTIVKCVRLCQTIRHVNEFCPIGKCFTTDSVNILKYKYDKVFTKSMLSNSRIFIKVTLIARAVILFPMLQFQIWNIFPHKIRVH